MKRKNSCAANSASPTRRIHTFFFVGLSAVVLSACATHNWAPGPNAKGTFDEAKAQCSLMARHSGSAFYASGTPSYVAGAAAGAAIGDAIRTQADFNDCMSASGWVVADPIKGQSAAELKVRAAAILQEEKDCISTIRNQPKYALLEPHHVSITTGRYSLVQMSDTAIPTPQEASLLAAYGDEIAVCQDKLLAEVTAVEPAAASAIRQRTARITDLNLQLIARKMTWGDYAQQATKLATGGGAGTPGS